MADRLYLSLWYPNFRVEALPAALTGVLRQFALIGQKRVSAASAYPINFTEPPTYQRIYVNIGVNREADAATGVSGSLPGIPAANSSADSDSIIENAVAEATEQLHDDMAYEFEMRWQLWTLIAPGQPGSANGLRSLAPRSIAADPYTGYRDSGPDLDFDSDSDTDAHPAAADPATPWRLRPHTVRVIGFGPRFDVAGYEQNGHLLVDFGLDTPWVMDAPSPTGEAQPLDKTAQVHIQQNIEKLLALTLLVEKNCGISSRLLWTESGEPLAEKLISRLQRVH
jgi:hypothetical protein